MELHFGGDVRGREDEKLGNLRRVLFDPETYEVIALVVQHAGIDDHLVQVPVGAIEAADHDGIALALSRSQFDDLIGAGEAHNIAPPPTADNLETQEEIAPVDVPDVPAVGAATGVESIAFTPIVTETSFAPAQADGVDGDMTIVANDGELGRVADVLVDDQTRRIRGFAVEKGFIFKSDTEVPLDAVQEYREGTIVLNVSRAALESERPHEDDGAREDEGSYEDAAAVREERTQEEPDVHPGLTTPRAPQG